MARQKKDSHPFSIKMDSSTYQRLQRYCERSGQPKTTAIERAVNLLIDQYEQVMGPTSQSDTNHAQASSNELQNIVHY